MSAIDPAWFDRLDTLIGVGVTRFYCARRAARWRHVAAVEGPSDAAFCLGWAARWRAAGKAIPRRIGMVCARARRRQRRRDAESLRTNRWDLGVTIGRRLL